MIDDGGPAFPSPCSADEPWLKGMSLLDWFAGQALAGYLAMMADPDVDAPDETKTARSAYGYAMAMLDERKRLMNLSVSSESPFPRPVPEGGV